MGTKEMCKVSIKCTTVARKDGLHHACATKHARTCIEYDRQKCMTHCWCDQIYSDLHGLCSTGLEPPSVPICKLYQSTSCHSIIQIFALFFALPGDCKSKKKIISTAIPHSAPSWAGDMVTNDWCILCA